MVIQRVEVNQSKQVSTASSSDRVKSLPIADLRLPI
jgi:hypothetical protein